MPRRGRRSPACSIRRGGHLVAPQDMSAASRSGWCRVLASPHRRPSHRPRPCGRSGPRGPVQRSATTCSIRAARAKKSGFSVIDSKAPPRSRLRASSGRSLSERPSETGIKENSPIWARPSAIVMAVASGCRKASTIPTAASDLPVMIAPSNLVATAAGQARVGALFQPFAPHIESRYCRVPLRSGWVRPRSEARIHGGPGPAALLTGK